jgi:D-glycerate 3-kinase
MSAELQTGRINRGQRRNHLASAGAPRKAIVHPLVLASCRLSASQRRDALAACTHIADWIARIKGPEALVLGIAGAQGSGKSTFSRLLAAILDDEHSYRVAVLSLDDLYLTRAQRGELSTRVHPLLITRGVPGTHDTGLGMQLIDLLRGADGSHPVVLPSFDKSRDERRPESQWTSFQGPADIVLFEGWCVGAKPQPPEALTHPVNVLEAEEDPHGEWRTYVNGRLATDYGDLFSRLDRLIMLKVPDLSSSYRWRREQEAELLAAHTEAFGGAVMDDRRLRRFMMHYERLTRFMLDEMPGRADRVLHLDQHHRFTHIGVRSAP